MIFPYIIIGVLLVFLLISIGGSLYFFRMLTKPKVTSYKEEFARIQPESFNISKWFEDKTEDKFTFKTSRGYTLRGGFIKNNYSFKDGKKRVVVMSHGYTSNSRAMARYARFYWDLGFDIALYDHRFHGESDKNTFCSMSFYEAKDLIELVPFLMSKYTPETIWGLQGESMGAATVMSAAPYIQNLSFVCEDCGFSNMKEQMFATMKLRMHLPSFPFVQLGELLLKAKYHFDYSDVVPVSHVGKITVPMLFMHGGDDDFVPTEMVYECYDAKKTGYKEMHVFEGSLHARSCTDYPEQYSEILKNFLLECNII